MPKYRPSPSAIALYQRCPRAAVARYVTGERPPDTDKTKLGKRLHAQTRRYLVDGVPPKDPAVQRLLPVLPPAGSVLEKSIERKVRLPMFSPHASIDFDAPTGPNDFKFTSSVQYAKTPAELRTDPQTLIYGMDWLERHPRAKSVTARWLYSEFYRPGAKRRGRIKVVSVTLTRAEIAEELARHVLPVARQLRRLVRAQADWTDVPISSDAYEAAPCNAYGTACHLVDRCPPPKTKWLQIVRFVGVPK